MPPWRLIAIAVVATTSLTLTESSMPAKAQLVLVETVKPLFEVKTMVPPLRRDDYFQALTEFAATFGLRLHIAPLELSKGIYQTDILSDYIVATGSNIRDEGVFRIGFLPALRASATHPMFVPPEETINTLRRALRERIGRVPSLRLLPE